MITVIDDQSDEHALPVKMEVCPRCEGRGTHTNPAIDGNGLTSEDFEEQGPEFREDYFAGVYDVTCERCGGRNVIEVVDRARCSEPLLELYDQAQADLEECNAIEGVQYVAALDKLRKAERDLRRAFHRWEKCCRTLARRERGLDLAMLRIEQQAERA